MLELQELLQEAPATVEQEIPAPFGWPGGKRQLAKKIVSLIPPHKTYVEPFAGAASVFWAKEPSEVEVLNDLDPDLMRFYWDIGKIEQCDIQTIAKDWDRLKSKEGNLEACDFLAATMCSYAQNRKGSGGANIDRSTCQNNAPQFHHYLPQYQERIRNTKLYNKDWKTITEQYDALDTFFYFDPPYHSTAREYKQNDDQLDRLSQILPKLKGKWLLSYDDSEDVRQKFSNNYIMPVETRYNYAPGKNKPKGSQLLIANYLLQGTEIQQLLEQQAPASDDMLRWQLKQILSQSILLYDHCMDSSCPCELSSAEEEPQHCIAKHLLALKAYSEETLPFAKDDDLKEKLKWIAGASSDLEREYPNASVEEIAEFARLARKEIEKFYYNNTKTTEQHGPAKVPITIKSLDGKRSAELTALVDTGATFTHTPQNVADNLELPHSGEVWEVFPDGRRHKVEFRNCRVVFDGKERATGVAIAPQPVIGYTMLEVFQVKPNPVTGELEPAIGPWKHWEMRFGNKSGGETMELRAKRDSIEERLLSHIPELRQKLYDTCAPEIDMVGEAGYKLADCLTDPDHLRWWIRQYGVKQEKPRQPSPEVYDDTYFEAMNTMRKDEGGKTMELPIQELLEQAEAPDISYTRAVKTILKQVADEVRKSINDIDEGRDPRPRLTSIQNYIDEAQRTYNEYVRKEIEQSQGPPRGERIPQLQGGQRPKLITYWKDTIEKHYYPKEDFYQDSFRVIKSDDVLVYLGCLKQNTWKPEEERCEPSQDVHKTITPRQEPYIREAKWWEEAGVEAYHRESEEGVEPR